MRYEVTTPPAAEPVVATDFRNFHVGIFDSGKEAGLNELVKAVRQYYERTFDKAIITQTITQYLDKWPDKTKIPLCVSPVASITSLTYIKPDATTDTLVVDTDFYLVKNKTHAYLQLEENTSYPDIKNRPNAVTIVYAAGDSAANVSENIKQWIRMAVAKMHFDKESLETAVGNLDLILPEIKMYV